MKKYFLTCILCAVIPFAAWSEQSPVPAQPAPAETAVQKKSLVPLGTWSYTVYVNKKKTGNATMSCVEKDGQYISTATITVQTGSTVVISKDTVIESLNFVPVSHETISTIVQNEKVERTKTTVTFKGHDVYINGGDAPLKTTVGGEFVISDNFFTSKLAAEAYRNGTKVTGFLYDHTFDTDNAVAVSVQVSGTQTLTIAKKKRTFIRIVETIGTIKDIETLIDNDGAAYKITMKLMNTTLELVRN